TEVEGLWHVDGRGVFVPLYGLCFFFSSRRRHTRLVSDWSSDVCSSDLQYRDILEHRLPAVAEARRLHGASRQRATQLVDDERGQRLALDLFGDDEERLAGARGLLEQRQHVLHHPDPLLADQGVGSFEDHLHPP